MNISTWPVPKKLERRQLSRQFTGKIQANSLMIVLVASHSS